MIEWLDPLMAGLAFLGPSAGAAVGGVISGRLAASRPPVLVMGLTSVAAALSLGTAMGGWRIMHTMGNRVVQLEPIHGVAAERTAS